MKKLFAACIAVLLLASCTTGNDWQSQPNDSGLRFTAKARSYDDVWTAAIRSVTRNLTIMDESKAQGRIRAQSSSGLMSGTEVISVTISPAGRNVPSYLIEVRSSRSKSLISGPDQTRNIVASIKAELGDMASEAPVSIKDSLSPSEEIITMPLPDRSSQPNTTSATSTVTSGEMGAQVERLARQSGCEPTMSAKLIARTTGVETYQTSCQNGQQALFKCEMRQCRRLD
ncbi:hypothetical protein QN360_01950 [Glaciimonas sp. CA11.2]|uniref:hypothetical protein n=1 Tax=Glaciimonas sp. CA11.2 TaxID=3048601 RepID=UPI002AB48DCE|nr:hypothetical protein [Glaciimonas sp. CA11.2]MDY7546090.1 hypothetical protein [Glaciimonas sp. CA11.2]MEB0161669.1 hypothetical protein [Glaciimonas sp. CA11.2]